MGGARPKESRLEQTTDSAVADPGRISRQICGSQVKLGDVFGTENFAEAVRLTKALEIVPNLANA